MRTSLMFFALILRSKHAFMNSVSYFISKAINAGSSSIYLNPQLLILNVSLLCLDKRL